MNCQMWVKSFKRSKILKAQHVCILTAAWRSPWAISEQCWEERRAWLNPRGAVIPKGAEALQGPQCSTAMPSISWPRNSSAQIFSQFPGSHRNNSPSSAINALWAVHKCPAPLDKRPLWRTTHSKNGTKTFLLPSRRENWATSELWKCLCDGWIWYQQTALTHCGTSSHGTALFQEKPSQVKRLHYHQLFFLTSYIIAVQSLMRSYLF